MKCEDCGFRLITSTAWFDGIAYPEPYEANIEEKPTEDDRIALLDLNISFVFCPKCRKMTHIEQS